MKKVKGLFPCWKALLLVAPVFFQLRSHRVYADCLGGTVKTESSVKDVGKF